MAKTIRALVDEREKYRLAATVLCGAHIGVPQQRCPVCERDALAERVRELELALSSIRLIVPAQSGIGTDSLSKEEPQR